jgi:MYND finger
MGVATDLIRHSNGKDPKMQVAMDLARVIVVLETEYLHCYKYNGYKTRYLEEMVNLDCVRNYVLFFAKRNPCSCLDEAKARHTEKMGKCSNKSCQKVCLDKKRLTCGQCRVFKYCNKECQEAHWREHKVRHVLAWSLQARQRVLCRLQSKCFFFDSTFSNLYRSSARNSRKRENWRKHFSG